MGGDLIPFIICFPKNKNFILIFILIGKKITQIKKKKKKIANNCIKYSNTINKIKKKIKKNYPKMCIKFIHILTKQSQSCQSLDRSIIKLFAMKSVYAWHKKVREER